MDIFFLTTFADIFLFPAFVDSFCFMFLIESIMTMCFHTGIISSCFIQAADFTVYWFRMFSLTRSIDCSWNICLLYGYTATNKHSWTIAVFHCKWPFSGGWNTIWSWCKINQFFLNWLYKPGDFLNKGFVYLALADPQKFFKQHLIKKEEQTSYSKIYSVHFGEVSTT